MKSLPCYRCRKPFVHSVTLLWIFIQHQLVVLRKPLSLSLSCFPSISINTIHSITTFRGLLMFLLYIHLSPLSFPHCPSISSLPLSSFSFQLVSHFYKHQIDNKLIMLCQLNLEASKDFPLFLCTVSIISHVKTSPGQNAAIRFSLVLESITHLLLNQSLYKYQTLCMHIINPSQRFLAWTWIMKEFEHGFQLFCHFPETVCKSYLMCKQMNCFV